MATPTKLEHKFSNMGIYHTEECGYQTIIEESSDALVNAISFRYDLVHKT